MVLRLWADYVEGERSDNINLPRITPWRFWSGLTYSRGDFYSTVNYTRMNKQDSTAPLETETTANSGRIFEDNCIKCDNWYYALAAQPAGDVL